MIRNELKLYLKSKLNILLLIFMTIPVILSYATTHSEWSQWQQQLENASPDLNIQKTQDIVDGYNGVSYLFNFIFSSDFFVIFLLIALMGFSCVFGARIFNHKRDGSGNMLIVRMGYGEYLKNVLLAQIVYVLIFALAYFIILTVITGVLFPFKFNYNITSNISLKEDTFLYCFGIYLLQIILFVLLTTLIMVITSLGDVIFHNKYIIHCIPLMIYFVPYILASTLGNLSNGLGNILSKFVFENNILALYFYSVLDISISESIANYLTIPIILLTIAVVMYFCNKKRFEGRYQ